MPLNAQRSELALAWTSPRTDADDSRQSVVPTPDTDLLISRQGAVHERQ
jgi:hypothetical protein